MLCNTISTASVAMLMALAMSAQALPVGQGSDNGVTAPVRRGFWDSLGNDIDAMGSDISNDVSTAGQWLADKGNTAVHAADNAISNAASDIANGAQDVWQDVSSIGQAAGQSNQGNLSRRVRRGLWDWVKSEAESFGNTVANDAEAVTHAVVKAADGTFTVLGQTFHTDAEFVKWLAQQTGEEEAKYLAPALQGLF